MRRELSSVILKKLQWQVCLHVGTRVKQGDQGGGYCNGPGRRLTQPRVGPEWVDWREMRPTHQKPPFPMQVRTVWVTVQLPGLQARVQRDGEEELWDPGI